MMHDAVISSFHFYIFYLFILLSPDLMQVLSILIPSV